MKKISERVSEDLALSVKVIKLVDSPFLGFKREIDSIQQAIVMMAEYFTSICKADEENRVEDEPDWLDSHDVVKEELN